MKMKLATRAIVAAIVLVYGIAEPAEGQAGLLRRAQDRVTQAVEDAVVGNRPSESGVPAPAVTAGAAQAAGGSTTTRAAEEPALLTMDAAVLDRFSRALTAEIGARTEWVAFEQSYKQCEGQMFTNPAMLSDFTRIAELMGEEMEKAKTTDDMIRVGEANAQRMDAIMAKHCGSSGSEFQARQNSANDDIMRAAQTAGNLSKSQYALLKERLVPFCSTGGISDRIPGPEGDHFYVYTAEEVSAIAPRCAELMPQVERTI